MNELTEYEVMKNTYLQQPTLNEEELKLGLTKIKDFIDESSNKYFMLLNRERYDFTLFNTHKKHSMDIYRIIDGLEECIKNRGDVVDIGMNKDKVFEIWIKIDVDGHTEAYVYYFFPYDIGVID